MDNSYSSDSRTVSPDNNKEGARTRGVHTRGDAIGQAKYKAHNKFIVDRRDVFCLKNKNEDGETKS